MKLFHWHSVLMSQWAPGDIVVIAVDAQSAREVARAQFKVWCKEQWWYEYDDERDEQMEIAREKLERDIAKEPTEHVAMFISGSE